MVPIRARAAAPKSTNWQRFGKERPGPRSGSASLPLKFALKAVEASRHDDS
jgi:hypothetical protein